MVLLMMLFMVPCTISVAYRSEGLCPLTLHRNILLIQVHAWSDGQVVQTQLHDPAILFRARSGDKSRGHCSALIEQGSTAPVDSVATTLRRPACHSFLSLQGDSL